jgi:hypothetical protein
MSSWIQFATIVLDCKVKMSWGATLDGMAATRSYEEPQQKAGSR